MKSVKWMALCLVLCLSLSGCGSPEGVGQGTAGGGAAAGDTGKESKDVPAPETGKADQAKQVKQEGPFGSITLSVPKDWGYECCETEDKNLTYGASYGIHLYPQKDSKYYIEAAVAKRFGACGTGLEQKKKKIAGDQAFVSYYDGADIWDFIYFLGKNEDIVVRHNLDVEAEDATAWWKKHKKEILSVLDTMEYNRQEQNGAIGVFDPEDEADKLNLTLEAKKVTRTGLVLCFDQYDGEEVPGKIFTGRYFQIQKKTKDGWKEAKKISSEGFHDIGTEIKKNKTTKVKYDWKGIYGELGEGDYKIEVEVGKQKAYAHFIIRG